MRGTVLSLSDRPIEGARVEAPMWGVAAVTGPDGNREFLLRLRAGGVPGSNSAAALDATLREVASP